MGNFSFGGFEEFQKKLNGIRESDVNAFVEACAKELASRLLTKVIKRTLPGQYPKKSGKSGGTLRRGWTAGQSVGSGSGNSVDAYVDSLNINHMGNVIQIEIVNPVEYAPYVEYGHRTANHKHWVSGQFMLTISEQEIQSIAPQVLEKKLADFLKGVMQ